MDDITFQWARLETLTASECHAILALRQSVFVVEQNCPYQDADELDAFSWHLSLRKNGELAAYLRVVDIGRKYAEPSIGRVASGNGFRGLGLGKLLVAEGLARSDEQFGSRANRISAQLYLKAFYEGFGFKAVSDEYLEDDIPHIEMLRSNES